MITFNNQDTLKQYVLDELKATDYAMLSDVKILNKNDFINYRRFLRQALQNLFLSTQFNERPQPVWGTTGTSTTTEQPTATGIQEI
jgi:hypothetical protein